MSDFERELEEELHRVLDPISARPIPPRKAVQSNRTSKTLMRGAGAALGVKVLSGVVAAAAAVTVAGVATTDSLNPTDWGQHVKQQVFSNTTTPDHGNGGISNDKTNGGAVPDANGDSSGGGSGNGNGHGKHLASPSSQPTMGPEPADPVGGGGTGGVPHKPVLVSPPPYVNSNGE